jgi:hypothetical protein
MVAFRREREVGDAPLEKTSSGFPRDSVEMHKLYETSFGVQFPSADLLKKSRASKLKGTTSTTDIHRRTRLSPKSTMLKTSTSRIE